MQKVVGKCVWSMWKVWGSASGVCGKFAGSGWEVCRGSVARVWEVPWKCVASAPEVLVEAVLEVVGGCGIVCEHV